MIVTDMNKINVFSPDFIIHNIINYSIAFGIVAIFFLIFYRLKSFDIWEKYKSKKWKILQNLGVIVFGLLIEGLCFSITFTNHILGFNFLDLTPLMIIWLFSIYVSPLILFGAIIPFLTINGIMYASDPKIIWFFFIIYTILIVFEFIRYSFEIKALIFKVIYIVIYTGIVFLLYWNTFGTDSFESGIIVISLNIAFLIASYLLAKFIISLMDKTKNLSRSISYEDKFFINASYANEFINDFIQKQNINKGIYLIFNFYGLDDNKVQLSNSEKSTITKDILDKVVFYLKSKFKDVLFFKTPNNQYACFIENNRISKHLNLTKKGNDLVLRDSLDPLKGLEEAFNNLPKTVKFNNVYVNTNFKAFASLYGINTCNIQKLYNQCNKLIDEHDITAKNSIVQCFFEDDNSITVHEDADVNEIKKHINIDNIDINFIVLKNMHQGNETINYASYFYFNLLTSNKNKIYQQVPQNLIPTLIRMLSATSLKTFKDNNTINQGLVMVDYPMQTINLSNYTVNQLYRNTIAYNIRPDQVILNFRWNNNEVYNLKNVYDNLEKIKHLGFKVCFENYSFVNQKLLKLVDYYFLINSDLSNNKKTNKVFFNDLKQVCNKYQINMLYIPIK